MDKDKILGLVLVSPAIIIGSVLITIALIQSPLIFLLCIVSVAIVVCFFAGVEKLS